MESGIEAQAGDEDHWLNQTLAETEQVPHGVAAISYQNQVLVSFL